MRYGLLKRKDNSTNLYTLEKFKIRYDKVVAKDYLAGRYGAVPVFKDFEYVWGKRISLKKLNLRTPKIFNYENEADTIPPRIRFYCVSEGATEESYFFWSSE